MGRNKRSKPKAKSRPETSSGEWFVPTGSTLLNLACSDKVDGGFATGKMVNVIGDSSSGKTILALTSLAETARLPLFDDFRMVYFDAESALEFDLGMFGDLEERLEIEIPETIEQVQSGIIELIDSGEPFVCVLDSLDSLSSDEEQQLVASEGESSSYRMGKARKLHETFRTITSKLKKSSGLVVIISQTRDKIGARFPIKYRTGERALEFYSSHVVWLSIDGKIERETGKTKRQVGITTRARVSKNRITGKSRIVQFPIYYDYGVDDTASMIDFLVTEGVWTKKGQTIDATDYDEKLTREKLILAIEQFGVECLVNVVGETWNEIEEDIAVNANRRGRFG